MIVTVIFPAPRFPIVATVISPALSARVAAVALFAKVTVSTASLRSPFTTSWPWVTATAAALAAGVKPVKIDVATSVVARAVEHLSLLV